jgi:hypothetical protein
VREEVKYPNSSVILTWRKSTLFLYQQPEQNCEKHVDNVLIIEMATFPLKILTTFYHLSDFISNLYDFEE